MPYDDELTGRSLLARVRPDLYGQNGPELQGRSLLRQVRPDLYGGDADAQPLQPMVRDATSQSGRALRQGFDMFGAGARLAGEAARYAVTGDEQRWDEGIDRYAERVEQAQARGPDIQDTSQIEGAGDAFAFGRNFLIGMVPDALATIATGGLAGGVTSAIARRAGASALRRTAERRAAARGTQSAIQRRAAAAEGDIVGAAAEAGAEAAVANQLGAEAARRVAEGTARRMARNTNVASHTRWAGTAGAMAGATAPQYISAIHDSADLMRNASPEEMRSIMATDTGAALIGSVPALRLLGRIGGKAAAEAAQEGAQKLLPRVGREFLRQGTEEAIAGVAHAATQLAGHRLVDESVDLLAPEALQRYLMEGVGSFLIGGGLSATHTGLTGVRLPLRERTDAPARAMRTKIRDRIAKVHEALRRGRRRIGEEVPPDGADSPTQRGVDDALHSLDLDDRVEAFMRRLDDAVEAFHTGEVDQAADTPAPRDPTRLPPEMQGLPRLQKVLLGYISPDSPAWAHASIDPEGMGRTLQKVWEGGEFTAADDARLVSLINDPASGVTADTIVEWAVLGREYDDQLKQAQKLEATGTVDAAPDNAMTQAFAEAQARTEPAASPDDPDAAAMEQYAAVHGDDMGDAPTSREAQEEAFGGVINEAVDARDAVGRLNPHEAYQSALQSGRAAAQRLREAEAGGDDAAIAAAQQELDGARKAYREARAKALETVMGAPTAKMTAGKNVLTPFINRDGTHDVSKLRLDSPDTVALADPVDFRYKGRTLKVRGALDLGNLLQQKRAPDQIRNYLNDDGDFDTRAALFDIISEAESLGVRLDLSSLVPGTIRRKRGGGVIGEISRADVEALQAVQRPQRVRVRTVRGRSEPEVPEFGPLRLDADEGGRVERQGESAVDHGGPDPSTLRQGPRERPPGERVAASGGRDDFVSSLGVIADSDANNPYADIITRVRNILDPPRTARRRVDASEADTAAEAWRAGESRGEPVPAQSTAQVTPAERRAILAEAGREVGHAELRKQLNAPDANQRRIRREMDQLQKDDTRAIKYFRDAVAGKYDTARVTHSKRRSDAVVRDDAGAERARQRIDRSVARLVKDNKTLADAYAEAGGARGGDAAIAAVIDSVGRIPPAPRNVLAAGRKIGEAELNRRLNEPGADKAQIQQDLERLASDNRVAVQYYRDAADGKFTTPAGNRRYGRLVTPESVTTDAKGKVTSVRRSNEAELILAAEILADTLPAGNPISRALTRRATRLAPKTRDVVGRQAGQPVLGEPRPVGRAADDADSLAARTEGAARQDERRAQAERMTRDERIAARRDMQARQRENLSTSAPEPRGQSLESIVDGTARRRPAGAEGTVAAARQATALHAGARSVAAGVRDPRTGVTVESGPQAADAARTAVTAARKKAAQRRAALEKELRDPIAAQEKAAQARERRAAVESRREADRVARLKREKAAKGARDAARRKRTETEAIVQAWEASGRPKPRKKASGRPKPRKKNDALHSRDIDEGVDSALNAKDGKHDLKKEARMLNAILARMGITERVTVAHLENSTGERGRYHTGSRTIQVDPSLTGAQRMEILLHELGHHVISVEITKAFGGDWSKTAALKGNMVERMAALQAANPKLYAALMKDFNAWQNKHLPDGSTLSDLLDSRKGPAFREGRVVAEGVAPRKIDDLTDDQLQYLFAMEEWFADNIVRALQKNPTATGVVRQFFASIADAIKRLYAAASSNNRNYAPAKSVEAYVSSLFDSQTQAASLAAGRPVTKRQADNMQRAAQERDAASVEVEDGVRGDAGRAGAPGRVYASQQNIAYLKDRLAREMDKPAADQDKAFIAETRKEISDYEEAVAYEYEKFGKKYIDSEVAKIQEARAKTREGATGGVAGRLDAGDDAVALIVKKEAEITKNSTSRSELRKRLASKQRRLEMLTGRENASGTDKAISGVTQEIADIEARLAELETQASTRDTPPAADTPPPAEPPATPPPAAGTQAPPPPPPTNLRGTIRYMRDNLEPHDRQALLKALSSYNATARLQEIYKDNPGALRLLDSATRGMEGKLALGYMAWRQGKINFGPKANNAASQIDTTLDAAKRVFGLVADADVAHRIFTDIADGTIQRIRARHRTYDARALEARSKGRLQKLVDWASQYTTPVNNAWNKVMRGRYDTALSWGIPEVRKVVNQLRRGGGATGHDRGIELEIVHRTSLFMQRASTVLEGLSQSQQVAVSRYLQRQDTDMPKANPKVRRAVNAMRALYDEAYDYLKEAGVDVGKRENFTPIFFDTERPGFEQRLTKLLSDPDYAEPIREFLEAAEAARAEDGAPQRKKPESTEPKASEIPPSQASLDTFKKYRDRLELRIREAEADRYGDDAAEHLWRVLEVNKAQEHTLRTASIAGLEKAVASSRKRLADARSDEARATYNMEIEAFEQRIQQLKDARDTQTKTPEGESSVSDAVLEMVRGAMHEPGLTASQGTPNFRSANFRSMEFIQRLYQDALKSGDQARIAKHRKNVEEFAKLQVSNPAEVFARYIDPAVKRAEYARRFGEDGSRLRASLERARKQGATDAQVAAVTDMVNASIGVYGADGSPVIRALSPKLAERLNTRQTQRVIQATQAYQNWRNLPLATLSSLADVMGIAVRTGGDFAAAWDGWKLGIKSLTDTQTKAEIHQMLQTLGAASDMGAISDLQQGFGGAQTPGSRRMNDALFRWNGLTAWTQATRYMALQSGHGFLLKHALRPNDPVSQRYLRELNVRPSDIMPDAEGRVLVLTPEERAAATPGQRAADDRVRRALMQFVDEAILRPSAAQTPQWHSDPYMGLVVQYKAFAYAIYDQIGGRIMRELKHGNPAVLLAALAYLPIVMTAELMREVMQHGMEGNPRRQDWGAQEYAWLAVERSALLGPKFEAVHGARGDIARGRLPGVSELGPTASQARRVLDGRNWAQDFEDALPLSALWKHHVNPLEREGAGA